MAQETSKSDQRKIFRKSECVLSHIGSQLKTMEKKKQSLKKESYKVLEFLENILFEHRKGKRPFAEHLRKAWNQWQIKKFPIKVIGPNTFDVAIRTLENFQEDLKFLCTSETVSTHKRCWGHHNGLLPNSNGNF